jgi:hypothetical protein
MLRAIHEYFFCFDSPDFLFVREQAGRQVDRVGVGAGDHLIRRLIRRLPSGFVSATALLI